MVLAEYFDYANVFLANLTIELSEHTGIKDYAIELEDDKQPPYRLIYVLNPVKLKTFKTYIKIHLKAEIIWPSKLFVDATILFDKNPNSSHHLCVDYWDFNNLTSKNRYPLPLMNEFLNWLGWAKHFT